ncbi:MAG: UPF0158 family protein [Candidatus Bipolaricaulota bacterium]|nr:hypothetical protein [Candidatus Bipolaricaulota bacterium]MBS3793087.1 hypothetical protein [Candidatus Bipolaricaulota bacterium]
MTEEIKIPELVKEMDDQMEDIPVFYNRETGEYVGVREKFLRFVESEYQLDDFSSDEERTEYELAEEILTTGKYLRIPSNYDIYEWEIIIDFIQKQGDESVKNELLDAINGSDPFRRFKEKILQNDVTRDWFRFKRKRFAEIAKYWCEGQKIGYREN